MNYIRPEFINLRNHDKYSEKWVQKIIEDDPSILGLGDLEVKDSERVQISGGRLDLLLSDPESNRRYEVEIQLGKLDESHIIRTIEYWDYERRRFPQYEHCAVIIAEDITSRFLNVISLFNGNIPIIAIQMKAVKIEQNISLLFTKVLDEMTLGTEEEEIQEVVDRNYWTRKSNTKYLNLMDKVMKSVSELIPGFEVNYNKHYIGLAKDGVSKNFISFNPRKGSLMLLIKHEQDEEISSVLDDSDLDLLAYDRKWKQYRMRLQESDVERNMEVILPIIEKAYLSYNK